MTLEEVKEFIEDNFSDDEHEDYGTQWNAMLHGEIDEDLEVKHKALGLEFVVNERGGRHNGFYSDDQVVVFKLQDKLYCILGSYSSYGGTEFDDSMNIFEVVPEQVSFTIYKEVKE